MKGRFIVFLLYLIFGLYFINSAFNIITFPEVVSKIDKWIIFIGGILIIIGGINSIRVKNKFRQLLEH